MSESLENTCRRLEHWETDEWSPDVILQHEVLTRRVVDPCTGTGILAEAAKRAGYDVYANDVHEWGYGGQDFNYDFLSEGAAHHLGGLVRGATVFMNPPFSRAVQFVERAFEMGARKIVSYQRFSWWESAGRREFWGERPPVRVYVCGNRASSWRHDIPKDQREGGLNPKTGKKRAGTPTAHAYFVWEQGHPRGPLMGHIWKDGGAVL